MSLRTQTTQPSEFIADPSRDGIANALWLANVGTLALAGTTPNRYRVNTGDFIYRADIKHGIIEFAVRVPLAGVQTPTNLVDDLAFGLKNISMQNLAKIDIFIDKSADAIYFRTYDDFGTVETSTLTWDTAWNGALTLFRFGWSGSHVSLDVAANGDTAYTHLADHKVSVPDRPLNPFITAVGAENLDVDFMSFSNIQNSSIMLV